MENEDFDTEEEMTDYQASQTDYAYDRMREDSYTDLEQSVKNLIEYAKKIPYFRLHNNEITLAKSIMEIVSEELLRDLK